MRRLWIGACPVFAQFISCRWSQSWCRMQTSFEPFTKKQKSQLEGYVSLTVRTVRGILFLGIVFLVGASLGSIHSSFAPKQGIFSVPEWWIVPSLAFTCWFFYRWRRWTGGGRGVTRIREDLARGEAAVHHVEALEAIEVEELEDEGPSYFILTTGREVLYLSGQWLDREKRRGFPWKTFDIVEAPVSRTFFGIKKTGERLQPAYVRKALDWDTLKRFKSFSGRYRILDVDFESLKTDPAPSPKAQ